MSEPVIAQICKDMDEFQAAGPGAIFLWRPGAIFLWRFGRQVSRGHIMMKCPGCGRESAMHVRTSDENKPKEGPS